LNRALKADLKTIAVGAALGFAFAFLGLMVSAYAVMILVGMWHGHNDAIPALGFFDSVYGISLVALLALIVAPVTRD
jgi:uncharacterized membrane protein